MLCQYKINISNKFKKAYFNMRKFAALKFPFVFKCQCCTLESPVSCTESIVFVNMASVYLKATLLHAGNLN